MEKFKSPVIKVSHAAKEILKQQPPAVYDQIQRGVYPPGVLIKLGERSYRFHRDNLLAWLANGGTAKAA